MSAPGEDTTPTRRVLAVVVLMALTLGLSACSSSQAADPQDRAHPGYVEVIQTMDCPTLASVANDLASSESGIGADRTPASPARVADTLRVVQERMGDLGCQL